MGNSQIAHSAIYAISAWGITLQGNPYALVLKSCLHTTSHHACGCYKYPPMPKKQSKHAISQPPRSLCPVAATLDILGDKWTLLVVRDLFLGCTRFKEFVASAERIPTNILSDRLSRLLRHEIAEQVPATHGGKRMAYRLTEKGHELREMLVEMTEWGLKWSDDTDPEFGIRRD